MKYIAIKLAVLKKNPVLSQVHVSMSSRSQLIKILAKPEEMGVVLAIAVPSRLTQKPEKGEWDLVSYFTPIEQTYPKIRDSQSHHTAG